jgi:hypothetical protein
MTLDISAHDTLKTHGNSAFDLFSPMIDSPFIEPSTLQELKS